MNLNNFPRQYQLLYALSKSLFVDNEFKCIAIISKTPYLTALAACHGAKIEIKPPYAPNTCLLLPCEKDNKKYVHAVIDNTEDFDGQKYYWYRYRKVRSNSISEPVRYAKPSIYLEKYGKIFPHKTPQNWLGKHDISSDDIRNLTNSFYPALIGHDAKAKLDYWKKVPLFIPSTLKLTMECLLNLSSQNGKFSDINAYSPKSFDFKRFESQIWINDVPENIEQGRFLIILSPTHNRYQDLISQVNDLYANNRLTSIEPQSIPSNLLKLGITNRALLVATLMRESIS
ncbi:MULTISPECIES: hypothetical protein [Acinetobacter]|jgi:hypothetical protein|uniref:hypothetical protein n=1 Tax=Acinetobacter TaxID=469 RepID=UPI0002CECCF2|nr:MULTISPECIES: hypothetical protein [Acinetobacter]ENX33407.1 hypothetical protein F890_00090 [Acinetobacter sp. CIP 64.7]